MDEEATPSSDRKMHPHNQVVELIGLLAVTLQIVRGFPQIHTLIKTRNSDGLSVPTWSLLLFTGACWWWWGLTQGQALTMVANGVSTLTALAILLYIAVHRRHESRRGMLLAIGFFAVVVAYSTTRSVPGALSDIAIAGALFAFAPQVYSVLTTDDHSGISMASWILAVLNTLVWMTYGVMVHSSTIVLPGFISAPLALAIIVRVVISRQHEIAETALSEEIAEVQHIDEPTGEFPAFSA